jgi:flagellar basal-body rod protein FlgG
MLDALYIAATGMQAQQLHVDTIANNLVNVATPGFKKGRVSFTDLMMREAVQVLPAASGDGAETGPLGTVPRLGTGVGLARVAKAFDQGELKQTGSMFDVAIQGDGFLEVMRPDGSRAYSRGGTLRVNVDGVLVSSSGHPLAPGIQLPANATGFAIGNDGQVLISVPGQGRPVEAGQLELVRFANPGALQALGDNLYAASDASGEPMAARPGEDGLGTLAQGYLEGSNVNMVDEMVNLMVAQRAYEASVKVVQASDEMLGMVNALRK